MLRWEDVVRALVGKIPLSEVCELLKNVPRYYMVTTATDNENFNATVTFVTGDTERVRIVK